MSNWPYDYEALRHEVDRLQTVKTWSQQFQQLIAQLLQDEETFGRIGRQLLQWQSAFSTLADEADWIMGRTAFYPFNPSALTNLLTRAQEMFHRFVQFVQGGPAPAQETGPIELPDAVPIGGHLLPPLPYPYNALEPHIDAQTMHLHHDRHHKTYVDGLNQAERMMATARATGDFDLLQHWERQAAFHGAGHYLHTIFWNVMSPTGGGEPTGALAEQVRRDFGSFDRFKQHFAAAAEKVEGGGWALLVWAPRARRLEILQAEKHQNLSQWDVIPLLVLDVWEHAYYLKYQNNRKAYIDAWWHLVNWPYVAERYGQARKVEWAPF